MSSDQQDNVDDPPNAQSSQSQEFAHRSASLTQAKSIQPQEPEENGVEKSRHKVMIGVFDAGEPISQESPGAVTLNTVQSATADFSFVDIFPPLASESEATIPSLVAGRLVAIVIEGFIALKEL